MSSKKGAQSGGLQVTGKVEHGWSRKLLVPEQRYVEFVDSLYSSSYRVLFCFIFGRLTNRKISSVRVYTILSHFVRCGYSKVVFKNMMQFIASS